MYFNNRSTRFALVTLTILCALALSSAQTNPVPQVNQPLVPAAALPGSPGFTLTINGTGFVAESVVNWNGSPRPTQFVKETQLTASIPDSDLVSSKAVLVTVVNSAPGGGTSNNAIFEVTTPIPTILPVYSALPGGHDSHFITVGDFNRDGFLDLAVANQNCSPGPCGPGSVSVLLGNGDGTFQPHQDYGTDTGPMSVIAVDLNNDGNLDIVTLDDPHNDFPGHVSVLLGNGDGTFQNHVEYGVDRYPTALVTADLNKDGKPDLVVAAFNGTQQVIVLCILMGNGDGTFQPATEVVTVPGNYLLTGDFNEDGNIDLAESTGNGVAILLGDGDGSFSNPTTYDVGAIDVYTTTGDVNGDGHLDLAASHLNGVSVLLGNGDGTFGAAVPYSADPDEYGIQTADLNGDGILDLISLGIQPIKFDGRVNILYGNGDGTFQPAIPFEGPEFTSPSFLALSDFNGDSRMDFAGPSVLDTVSLYLQDPTWYSTQELGFPDQPIGHSSDPQSVSLTNVGGPRLKVSNVAISGLDAADFIQSNTCRSGVPGGGGTCQFTVTFTPHTKGPKSAVLTVKDSSPSGSQTINLSGVGTNGTPTARLSSAQIDFGNQLVGTLSSPQNDTLTNTGTAPLKISSIVAGGDFGLHTDCGTTLAAGASCTMRVQFKPRSRGVKSGTITITDNAPGSPHTIALTGEGTVMSVSPVSLDFGNQQVGTTSNPQTVTLTNTGAQPMKVLAWSIRGGNGVTDYAATTTCGDTVPAHGTCTFGVTFTPTKKGKRNSALSVAGGGGNAQSVGLTGTGT